MTATGREPLQFQAGGVVRPGSFYGKRRQDEDLYQSLLEHAYVYVLGPRQIGKSSLADRVGERLKEEGKARCANVDLTMVGTTDVSCNGWLGDLAQKIGTEVGIPRDDVFAFWEDPTRSSPVRKWTEFFSELLLRRVEGDLVIFLDEIDAVTPTTFCADFFLAIRALCNGRKSDPALARLTFCLIGATTRDRLTNGGAPFNVGHDIPLGDLSRDEMEVFRPGLAFAGPAGDAVLEAVFRWTSGHPYMTQRIFKALKKKRYDPSAPAEAQVEEVVRECFLLGGHASDLNLGAVDQYFTMTGVSLSGAILLYRRVLERLESEQQGRKRGEPIHTDSLRAAAKHLWLAGLVAQRPDATGISLHSRNPIFAKVFDLDWVRTKEADLDLDLHVRDWLDASDDAKDDFALRGAELQRALKREEEKDTEISAQAARFLRASSRRERRMTRAFAMFLAVVALLFIYLFLRTKRAEDQVGELKQLFELTLSEPGSEKSLGTAIKSVAARRGDLTKAPDVAIDLLVSGLMGYRDVTVVGSHPDRVFATTFSPDGRSVLTAGQDGIARIWSLEKPGAPPVVLDAHTGALGALRAASFSPDGALAAVAGEDGMVRLWDVASATPAGTLEGHKKDVMVNFVAFSPDGKLLATASDDHRAILWDVAHRKQVRVLEGHSDEVNQVTFSPDGAWLVTASTDKTARVWSAADGRSLATLEEHSAPLNSAIFSPDNETLITADDNGVAKVWSTKGWKPIEGFSERWGGITRAEFSPDGTLVAAACNGGNVRIHDARTGILLTTFRGHKDDVFDVAFSPDGRRLVTASADTTVRVWEVALGRPLLEMPAKLPRAVKVDEVLDVAYRRDDAVLATASTDGSARLWNATTGGALATLAGHQGPVNKVAFAADGRVVTAGKDGTARLWTAEGRPDKILPLPPGGGAVKALAISDDGQRVVTASDAGSLDAGPVIVWSTADGLQVRSLEGLAIKNLRCVAISRDGSRVVAGGDDGQARLWNVASGQGFPLVGHQKDVRTADFSPDGSRIVTSSNDKTVRVWDASTGELVRKFEDHNYNVLAANFSKDGSQIASASWDETARLWRSPDGWSATGPNPASMTLTDPARTPVYALAFSPDGIHLATGGANGTVWDTQGHALPSFTGGAGHVWAVAFSHDGRRLAVASTDGKTRVYAATPEGLLAQACQLLSDRSQLAPLGVEQACAPYLKTVP